MIARTNLRGRWWFIAFLFFPYGPVVCLWKSGACSMRRCIGSIILLAAFNFLFIAALSKENDNPLAHGWILLSYIMFNALTGYVIFNAGMRLHLWPRNGLKAWKGMACILLLMTLPLMATLTARLYLS